MGQEIFMASNNGNGIIRQEPRAFLDVMNQIHWHDLKEHTYAREGREGNMRILGRWIKCVCVWEREWLQRSFVYLMCRKGSDCKAI